MGRAVALLDDVEVVGAVMADLAAAASVEDSAVEADGAAVVAASAAAALRVVGKGFNQR